MNQCSPTVIRIPRPARDFLQYCDAARVRNTACDGVRERLASGADFNKLLSPRRESTSRKRYQSAGYSSTAEQKLPVRDSATTECKLLRGCLTFSFAELHSMIESSIIRRWRYPEIMPLPAATYGPLAPDNIAAWTGMSQTMLSASRPKPRVNARSSTRSSTTLCSRNSQRYW